MRHTPATRLALAFLSVFVLGLVGCGGVPVSRGSGEEGEFNRCLRLSAKKRYDESVECLEVFKSRYPASGRAAEAELRVGDSYFRKKDYALAAESYAQFIRLHPFNERIDYAYYRLGLSHFSALPKAIDRDQSNLNEVIEAFETVVRSYPQSPYAKVALLKYNEARGKAARELLYIGKFYYRTGEYRAALPRFDAILEENADPSITEVAAYLKLSALLKIGEKDKAEETLSFLDTHFKGSALAQKAARKLGHPVTKEETDDAPSQSRSPRKG